MTDNRSVDERNSGYALHPPILHSSQNIVTSNDITEDGRRKVYLHVYCIDIAPTFNKHLDSIPHPCTCCYVDRS